MPFFSQFIAFLMIAVCFNTAIGVPLHAAEHLKGGMAQGRGQVNGTAVGTTAAGTASRVVVQTLVEAGANGQVDVDPQSSSVAASGAQPEGKSDSAVELCAVCAAYGQSMADFVVWPAAPPDAQTSSPITASDAPPPGAAVQWPYAARDPPRA